MATLKIFTLKAYREEIKGIIRDNRVVWMSEELGIDYERIALDAKIGENKTPEFLKISPFAKAPAILDGDFAMTESAAICQYLAQKHGRLIPAVGTPEYFECVQWCYFSVSNLEPHSSRIFACDFTLDKIPELGEIRKLAVAGLDRFLPKLDELLGERQTLLSSGFSVADVLLVTAFIPVMRSNIIESHNNIDAYIQRMCQRPGFKKSQAVNGL